VLGDWTVRVRGASTPKLVVGAEVQIRDEFLAFVDGSGRPLLVVRRDEVLEIERYEEPLF
jgi:hypothetical protein